ncbi:DUF3427 domain-containing protein, partial [Lactiplantibacillus garii]|uniref:DUF3427 domain-containing protein n=1 Tax=Lactiplantibacillus garii TaxID=2306423 RepID=UPI0013159D2F
IIRSVERVLSLEFFVTNSQKKYGNTPIVTLSQNTYRLNSEIQNQLIEQPLFRKLMEDAVRAGIMRASRYQINRQFTLYQRYTRKDVWSPVNKI